MITLTIDGKTIETQEGKSILEAARDNGIDIPTLCYHEQLLPIGSCRLCIVQVEGCDKPVTSCTSPAREGISVTTQSDTLFAMRREFLQLILSYHPLDCPQCDKGGQCRLQDLVYAFGIEKAEYALNREGGADAYPTPLIKYWEKRCVLCGRCFHACREIAGREAIDIAGTGSQARVAAARGSDCISCGECLSLCPVGALTEQLSPVKKRIWQGVQTKTTCPHCGFGCQVVLDVAEGGYLCKVTTAGTTEPNRDSLCVRGRFGYDFANSETLLRTPRLSIGHNQRGCDLEEAVNQTAANLQKLEAAKKGIGFVVSPRSTNEEIYLVAGIAKRLGNAPVGSAAHYHTGRVLDAMQKAGMTLTSDFGALAGCDLIIAAGAGLLANNHLLANKVRETVKSNGSRVIVIDPLPTPLTRIADAWLQIEPGTDAALLNCLSGRLIAQGKHAREAEALEGFGPYAASLKTDAGDQPPPCCGISGDAFEKGYRLIGDSAKIGVIFGSGISADEHGMAALLDFCLLKDIPNRGAVLSVSLQANALGTCLIAGDLLPTHEVLFNPGLAGLVIFEDNPFVYLDGTPLRESLEKLDFLAWCDILPSPVTELAQVAVPSSPFSHKNGTFITGDGTVSKLRSVTDGSARGFEFLRLLLFKLGGPRYESAQDVTEAMVADGILKRSQDGLAVASARAQGRFIVPPSPPAPTSSAETPYKLILRDLFMSDYLTDRKSTARGIGLVGRDTFAISRESAAALGVEDGDLLVVENDRGSSARSVTIKDGLRRDVLEATLFKERQNLLKLAAVPSKVIAVSLTKG